MKKNLLLFMVLVCIANINFAQTNFAALQNIDPNTGIDPTFVVSGDLDGDTDIDIAIGTYNYNGGTPSQDYIKWYENDGSGNFTIKTEVSTTIQWVQGLTIADVDGINGNDIVATAAVGSKLVYYPNNGSGGFGAEVVISNTINDPGHVVVGDINNDGNLDLTVASYTDNEVIWFAGDGSGGFTEQTLTPILSGSSNNPYYLDIADFEGDGDLDILVGFYTGGAIEIYYNQFIESGGAMTVSWIKDTVPVETSSSLIWASIFADVNNDGVLDVIKSDFNTGDVRWFSKIKNGTSTPTTLSNTSTRSAALAVIDIDNDTYKDVIATDGGGAAPEIIWFKGANNAAPTYVEPIVAHNTRQYWAITVNDLDDDGDKDIAVVNVFSNTLDWYENQLELLSTNDNSLNEFTIYPNPASNELHFKGTNSEPLKMSIFDIIGNRVLTTTSGINKPLNITKLQSGMYILKLNDYNTSYKFIKE